MNVPYFSRVDQQPATTFASGTCGFDRVYINQLQPGDRLVSLSSTYVHAGNGLLVGVDERFTRFDVIRNGETLHTLAISWQTDCTNDSQLVPVAYANGLPNLPIPVLLMIVSLVYLAVLRRIRR